MTIPEDTSTINLTREEVVQMLLDLKIANALMEKDREDAAGELLVNLLEAPPGSTLAKLLIANKLLKDELGRAQSYIVDLEDR
jgi:hypothetical protein